ncbi:chaperone protein DnaJ [Legionella beliardensis]|uniref:Chaperone protein DnaJ n=1 Tax=Legionella beliardensis TaxID=91822 RepID=A0A378I442_9GAMM|nr:DnaJ domain-containing protein [Legionella beliardensis]STX29949.1 chaperone protein DnaJ [Legionella beliardensis]
MLAEGAKIDAHIDILNKEIEQYTKAYKYLSSDELIQQHKQAIINETFNYEQRNEYPHYFKILGLDVNLPVTDELIQQAYRRFALNYHPDKKHISLEKELYTAGFNLINEARQALLNPTTRENCINLFKERRLSVPNYTAEDNDNLIPESTSHPHKKAKTTNTSAEFNDNPSESVNEEARRASANFSSEKRQKNQGKSHCTFFPGQNVIRTQEQKDILERYNKLSDSAKILLKICFDSPGVSEANFKDICKTTYFLSRYFDGYKPKNINGNGPHNFHNARVQKDLGLLKSLGFIKVASKISSDNDYYQTTDKAALVYSLLPAQDTKKLKQLAEKSLQEPRQKIKDFLRSRSVDSKIDEPKPNLQP